MFNDFTILVFNMLYMANMALNICYLKSICLFFLKILKKLFWIHILSCIQTPQNLSFLIRSREAAVQRCSTRKDVLKNFSKFTGKHLCQSLEIFKNSFFYKTPASGTITVLLRYRVLCGYLRSILNIIDGMQCQCLSSLFPNIKDIV